MVDFRTIHSGSHVVYMYTIFSSGSRRLWGAPPTPTHLHPHSGKLQKYETPLVILEPTPLAELCIRLCIPKIARDVRGPRDVSFKMTLWTVWCSIQPSNSFVEKQTNTNIYILFSENLTRIYININTWHLIFTFGRRFINEWTTILPYTGGRADPSTALVSLDPDSSLFRMTKLR